MLGENSLQMTIGELAKQVGVATSAIRFYESRGLVSSVRTEGGQRRYDGEAVLKLQQLSYAQSAGFTLVEIGELLVPLESGEPLFGHWQRLAERKLEELDGVIARAEEMKRCLRQALACHCVTTDACGLLT